MRTWRAPYVVVGSRMRGLIGTCVNGDSGDHSAVRVPCHALVSGTANGLGSSLPCSAASSSAPARCEMYTWGRNDRLGYAPQARFFSPRIHFTTRRVTESMGRHCSRTGVVCLGVLWSFWECRGLPRTVAVRARDCRADRAIGSPPGSEPLRLHRYASLAGSVWRSRLADERFGRPVWQWGR